MDSSEVDCIKVAQAATDLNVPALTIRRYIQDFEIETLWDKRGSAVLPPEAMKELKQIRRLKEAGQNNHKVMAFLQKFRKR